MPTIKLEQVSKYYKVRGHGESVRHVETGVTEIDITIEQGDFVFVIGSSGAGKSTLLKLITGELKPNRGRVLIDGVNLSRLFIMRRRLIGKIVGRSAQGGLLVRRLTVEENLMNAARIGKKAFESKRQMKMRVDKVLGLVGMPWTGEKYPAELNISETRRVELAMALVNNPSVLVLDEITANLDDDTIWDIFHLLTEINRRGCTVIIATHAGSIVNIMRKRVITLVDGRIYSDVQQGKYEAARGSGNNGAALSSKGKKRSIIPQRTSDKGRNGK